jgi:uncharacterized membrane protein YfcA
MSFLVAFLVGFVAESIDGALGMAYGLISNTVLLTFGYAPAVAGASVHMAEIVTAGVSGFSHWRLGNVKPAIVRALLLPGVLGGLVGVYVLTSVPTAYLRPVVAGYILAMGLVGIVRVLRRAPAGEREGRARLPVLGLAGGLCDAMGGGGWGQVVTSTLIARGNPARYTVGSVTFTEFFVALAESVAFMATIGIQDWRIVGGLMLGGALAAPLAAWTASRLPNRPFAIAVGVFVVATSANILRESLPALLRLL